MPVRGTFIPALFALVACGHGTRSARAPQTPVYHAQAATVLTPVPGGSSSETRVPTGPEHCFDARDDNGNGLVDEGCGEKTGLVQFVVAWDAPTADVDLLVTDPQGELVEVGSRSAAGLVKERDCPGRRNECHGKNVENVYLEGDESKRGTYRVRIRLEQLGAEDVPIHVTFAARLGPKAYSGQIELSRPEEEKALLFVL